MQPFITFIISLKPLKIFNTEKNKDISVNLFHEKLNIFIQYIKVICSSCRVTLWPSVTSSLFLVNLNDIVLFHLQSLGSLVIVDTTSIKEETQGGDRYSDTLTKINRYLLVFNLISLIFILVHNIYLYIRNLKYAHLTPIFDNTISIWFPQIQMKIVNRNTGFKPGLRTKNHLFNLCSNAVNSQSKSWCEMFVLNLSGIQSSINTELGVKICRYKVFFWTFDPLPPEN